MFLSFAVAYLGATLAVLNPRLSDEERLLRKVELENASNQNNITILTEEHIQRMIIDSLGIGIMELAHEPNGQIPVNPRTMEILSYAEKKEREFDPDHIGLIMFTSGSSGTPKATQLSWRSLHGAAVAATKALCKPGKGIWQLVLPMCHIGGFEVMVRSLVNESPFLLYLRYQPSRLLNDALSFKVTHISVVDKILQDLLAYDNDRIIAQYKCILLGGAALNKKTIKQALRARASVFASLRHDRDVLHDRLCAHHARVRWWLAHAAGLSRSHRSARQAGGRPTSGKRPWGVLGLSERTCCNEHGWLLRDGRSRSHGARWQALCV